MPYINVPYVRLKGNSVIVDSNIASYDIISYKVVNGIYRSQTHVIDELQSNGLNVTDSTEYTAPKSIELLTGRRYSFKDLFDLYASIKGKDVKFYYTADYRLELIETMNPLVRDAYYKLGPQEVKRLNYHTSNIRREIVKRSLKSQDHKIVELVNGALPLYQSIPVSRAKAELQEIYNLLGLDRKARATDLKKWFETKENTKRINGKNVACITLVRSKYIAVKDDRFNMNNENNNNHAD